MIQCALWQKYFIFFLHYGSDRLEGQTIYIHAQTTWLSPYCQKDADTCIDTHIQPITRVWPTLY